MAIFPWGPSNVSVKRTGVWKKHDFRQLYRFISEMMQDRAILTMEGEYKTVPKLSNGTIFNDLDDL